MQLWHAVSEGRRQEEFNEMPKLGKLWTHLNKKSKEKTPASKKRKATEISADFDKTFLPNLVNDYLRILDSIKPSAGDSAPGISRHRLLTTDRFESHGY